MKSVMFVRVAKMELKNLVGRLVFLYTFLKGLFMIFQWILLNILGSPKDDHVLVLVEEFLNVIQAQIYQITETAFFFGALFYLFDAFFPWFRPSNRLTEIRRMAPRASIRSLRILRPSASSATP